MVSRPETNSAFSFLGRLFQENGKKTVCDNEIECFVSISLRASLSELRSLDLKY